MIILSAKHRHVNIATVDMLAFSSANPRLTRASQPRLKESCFVICWKFFLSFPSQKHFRLVPVMPTDTLYVRANYISELDLLKPPAKFWLERSIWQVLKHHLEVLRSWRLVDKTDKVPGDFWFTSASDLTGRKEGCSICFRGFREHRSRPVCANSLRELK